MIAGPLTGRRVVTTRDEIGELETVLEAAGAEIVHVPLIAIVDRTDTSAALADAAAALGAFDWLVVTSRHGARRIGDAAGEYPDLHLAAVGSVTAAELADRAGRPVDVVPQRQTAADLVAAMPDPAAAGSRVLIAQADRAEPTLADGLAARGYDVVTAIVYRTELRHPGAGERAAALASDAVGFASGSAALAWAAAIGRETPPIVAAIGPTTEAAARKAGLIVTDVAADHSVAGLAACISRALAARPQDVSG